MPTILDSFPALDPAEAAAIGPFLTVQPGQLIRAADWNALQVQTRQEMARAARFVQAEATRLGESVNASQSVTSAELAALRADILSLINGIPGEKIDPTSNLTIKHLRADDLSLGDWTLMANASGHLQVGTPTSPSRLVIDPTTATLQGDLVVTGQVRSSAGGPKWSTAATTSTTASQISTDLASLTVSWTGTGRPTLALFKSGGVQVDSAGSSPAQITFELIHRQQVRVRRLPESATRDPAAWTSLIAPPDGTLRIASRGGQTWAINRGEMVYRMVQGNWELMGGPTLSSSFPFGEQIVPLSGVDVSIAPDGTVFVLGGAGGENRTLMRWEGGTTWTPLPMMGQHLVARSRTEVYVTNTDLNLFLSTDGGASYQHLGGGFRDLALDASGHVQALRADGSTWNITNGVSTPSADPNNPAVFATADALGPIYVDANGNLFWQDGGKPARPEVFATHVSVDEQNRVFVIAPKGPASVYTPSTYAPPVEVWPGEVWSADPTPLGDAPEVLSERIIRDDTAARVDSPAFTSRAALSGAAVSLREAAATPLPETLTASPRLGTTALGLDVRGDLTLPTDALIDGLTTIENRDKILASTTLDFSSFDFGQGTREVQLLWMDTLPPGAYTFLVQWRVTQPTTRARVNKHGDSQLLLVTEL